MTQPQPSWSSLLLTLMLASAACTDPPQVRVNITADPGVGSQATHVRVMAFGMNDVGAPLQEARIPGDVPALHLDPLVVVLAPTEFDKGGPFRVLVELRDETDTLIAVQQAIGEYGDGPREIGLHFADTCLGVLSCGDGQACDNDGVCEPACVVPTAATEGPSERVPCGCDVLANGAVCDDGAGRCLNRECCTGCVDGDECVLTNSDAQCGLNGVQCASCCAGVGEGCTAAGFCDGDTPEMNSGAAHSCTGGADQTWCWGSNEFAQLGGTPDENGIVTLLGSGNLTAGTAHTCRASFTGQLQCWGSDAQGALGYWTGDQPVPPDFAPDAGFTQVVAGDRHTCGIRGGELYCWGSNGQAELGVPATDARVPPTRILPEQNNIESVDAHRTTCAISRDGSGPGLLRCWGRNQDGQAGRIGGGDVLPEDPILTEHSWARASTGRYGTCAITDDMELFCWGILRAFQLQEWDDETMQGREAAGAVQIPGEWRRVSVGELHSCGIRDGGTLFCWGSNRNLQLGSPFANPREPAPIPAGPTGYLWQSVHAGVDFTCAVRSDATIWCWGSNERGQLGRVGSGSAIASQVCFPRETSP